MSALMTVDEYKLRSVLPDEYVAAIEARKPGWTAQQLAGVTAEVYAALSKRYVTPFSVDHEVPRLWAAAIVDARVLIRRGVDPDELAPEVAAIFEAATTARAQIQSASDSETGLFELPLRSNDPTSPTAVTRGGPFSYSETSPYVFTDSQRERGRDDDASGRGR